MDYLKKAQDFAQSDNGKKAINSQQGKDFLEKAGLTGAAASFMGSNNANANQQSANGNQQQQGSNDPNAQQHNQAEGQNAGLFVVPISR